jgi:hypothetical protein
MPEEIDNKPTVDLMRRWRDDLNGEWMGGVKSNVDDGNANLDSMMEKEENLYFQRFSLEAPNGMMAVKTGSAPSDADAAIDSLAPPPKIQLAVKPLRARDKYKKQADKLKKFGLAIVEQWRRPKDVLRLVASDMVIRRVGVARVMLDETLWPDMPEELREPPDLSNRPESEYEEEMGDWEFRRMAWEVSERGRCPIIFERRNPRFTRWREYRGRMLVVCESYSTTVIEAFAAFSRYPKAREILKNRQLMTVTVDEIWYDKWRCILLNNEPIFSAGESEDDGDYRGVAEHGYPCIPYVIAPFRELPFDDAERRYRGMLTNSAGLYPIESQVMTMHVWMLRWNAWRTFKGHTNDGRAIDVLPGKYIDINPQAGEYLEMLEGEPVPPQLLQTQQVVDGLIQRNSVAQGPRSVEGTRSAQQLWAIQNARQKKLDPARNALQMMVDQSLSIAAMILEKMMQEPLTLPVPGREKDGTDSGEVTISPKDIAGYYDGFRSRFNQQLDPAQMEQSKSLMTFALNNWMPRSVSWELAGFTDSPQEWEDELMDQSVEGLPFMQEFLALKRFEQYFGKDSDEYKLLLTKIMEAKQQAAMGGPGQPAQHAMTPGSPKGPVAAPGGQPGSSSMSPSAGAPKPEGSTRSFGQTGGGAKPPPGGM